MNNCLVGYTGTVGKNLLNQCYFKDLYNSKNIENIKNKEYDELYLSCLPATKWIINKNPDDDNKNTQNLVNIISSVKAKFVVLISTIDVYPNKNNKMNEDYIIDNDKNDTYGKNRFIFENFVKTTFENYLIVRLPGVFGDYLKKNIIFDLLNNNNVDKINLESSFQWYFLDNLYDDIQYYRKKNVKIINLFTEPISNSEIIKNFFPSTENICKGKNKVNYDLCTKYDDSGYIQNKESVLNNVKIYIERVRLNNYLYGGMSNFIFSNLAWNVEENNQVIELLKENNMNRVELALTKFYKWEEFDDEKILEIKKYFNSKNFYIYSLQAITFGLNYNMHDETREKLMKHLQRVIRYAKLLGCRLIVFGSPKNRSYNNNYNEEKTMDFFRELNMIAKDNNIIVCIEPNAKVYGCNFLWNLEQTYQFVKKLNCSHIKMMADTGCMSFENDSIFDIYKYKDMIEHIHLSEQHLEILTDTHTNHKELDKILIDSGKTFVTIEMKTSENNINKIYKTINFLKENYRNLIAQRNNL
jgi:sugar phosphate isomerase/epimerase